MKPVIIAIVGPSGSGKTYLSEYLENAHGITMIRSYTDRAPRYENETGHTFVSKEEFDKFEQGDMIAFTKFGGNRYCCLKKDVLPINSYVIDEHGIEYLNENYSNDYDIVSVYVHRNRGLRQTSVSPERLARDSSMFKLPPHYYDYVVNNSFSLESLMSQADTIWETVRTTHGL